MAEIETVRPLIMDQILDPSHKSAPIDILSSNQDLNDSDQIASSYPKYDLEIRTIRNTRSESSILSLISRRSAPEHRYFVAQFLLASTSAIRTRLLDYGQRICLRSYSASRYHLSGTLLIRDGSLDKRVFVRYTLDNWRTSIDKQATFLDHDLSIGADRFHFRLDFPFRLANDTRLQLALAYCVNGYMHWDNNGGLNYTFTYNYRSNSLSSSSSISECDQ